MSSPEPSSRLVIPPEIEAEMTPAVKAFVEFLIDHYETRIADLESQIQKLTPHNSSLPPSTQHPHAKPKPPKREGQKKKRGGQPGHPKHQRELIPTEQCDEVIPLQPDACRQCDTPLTGIDPDPLRHQVWELPQNCCKPRLLPELVTSTPTITRVSPSVGRQFETARVV